ncbi:MAG: hypothetical protein HYV95_09040 [Opitutae bacterium]|nr:hypothetical protein [Opitutae bacterium]
MRRAAVLLLALHILLGGGCAVVVTTAMVAGSVAAATVATAGKVTVATVKTTGKVAASAVTSSGDVAALSMESAARLARAGMVVVVDGASGAVTEMPWREGLRLAQAVEAGRFSSGLRVANIFRRSGVVAADLARVRAGREDHALLSGDVLELRR